MSRIAQIFTRPLCSREFNYKVAYHSAMVFSAFLILTGIFKVTRMPLTEKEMLVGLGLAVLLGLGFMIIALQMKILAMLESRDRSERVGSG